METQNQLNYNRIAEAIAYIKENFKSQPNLDDVAKKIHVSPSHFQKMFTEWAGTSLKKFLQFISIEHAKNILKEEKATIFDTAHETGLSSTSRLHDLFINIEGMTPAEYKNGGKNLHINYSFAESPFGSILVASTSKGICSMAFENYEETAFKNLQQKFPNATFHKKLDLIQQNALFIFQNDWNKLQEIKLHLKGTDFQLKVWKSLLEIPLGSLSTYGNLAHKIGNSNASRAVGTAIGKNPVAYLIPCHRVIQSTGNLGEYMWGSTRKTVIIGWEGVKTFL
ncbi:bifunctional helix-turn-helix domain-containing protein/methylated-DNA--[protein]-cysteine S-methyltransferase [Zhouia sp. PK063]|uniref:bifunctional helix-turn-helix domain-containing protein/methylated-DNA--[protein]-cysteine S-methyltransferase n=1 Tax=Zhouia sp. PK063 TaxID=3373602 RepID=UPI0037BC9A10